MLGFLEYFFGALNPLSILRSIEALPLLLGSLNYWVWLVLIAGRAWMADKWTPDIEGLFYDCIGIIIAYFIVPWRYVWARYFAQPMEPLRQKA